MDKNNQTSGFNDKRIIDRSMDELIGICRGILFDGVLLEVEAQNLHQWMLTNNSIQKHPFGKELFDKLDLIISNATFSADDEKELTDIFINLTGAPEINTKGDNAPTSLPLCKNPPKTITMKDHHFALTGNFTSAKRKDVEMLIKYNGGHIKKNANSMCDYLVIGEVGSGAWIHTSFGRKIEEAVQTRSEGNPISIITEEHFFDCINPPPDK